MKKLARVFSLSFALCLLAVSVCRPAQIVCIGLETEREGICDIWDVVEVHDDDVYLGGSGYETFEIIWISNMARAELMALLDLVRVEIQRAYNDEGDLVKFWFNEESSPPAWYEIHVQPKYQYTVEDFTHEDIVILADELATTSAKAAVVGKTKDKVTLYPQNHSDTMPKQK